VSTVHFSETSFYTRLAMTCYNMTFHQVFLTTPKIPFLPEFRFHHPPNHYCFPGVVQSKNDFYVNEYSIEEVEESTPLFALVTILQSPCECARDRFKVLIILIIFIDTINDILFDNHGDRKNSHDKSLSDGRFNQPEIFCIAVRNE